MRIRLKSHALYIESVDIVVESCFFFSWMWIAERIVPEASTRNVFPSPNCDWERRKLQIPVSGFYWKMECELQRKSSFDNILQSCAYNQKKSWGHREELTACGPTKQPSLNHTSTKVSSIIPAIFESFMPAVEFWNCSCSFHISPWKTRKKHHRVSVLRLRASRRWSLLSAATSGNHQFG